ncbi:MAG: ABC transporter ATP-binding protein [Clostridia bacterium]|nr:ABC transporter ATP-binding protein [Clostridia bacterium]
MAEIVRINAVKKLYKNNRGIKDITISVNKGDVLGLLGPNGSGKTTIMKLLCGLIRKNSGELTLFGLDAEDNFERVMKSVGSLIEAPAIYKKLSAIDNLMLVARMHGVDKEKALETLKTVGLLPYANDHAERFSLGMKQRLGLSMALVGNPELVILDEPVNGLDIEGVVGVREIIEEQNKKGTTFIISSHIASELEKVCNRVAVLYDGEVAAEDTVSDIERKYPSLEEYFLEQIKQKRGALL